MAQELQVDVAIIGGGPGGTTVGTLIKKYAPHLNVLILEREKFPREHIGESQLPPIGAILSEMGCYDKVENAHFPIKIGATFRWGNSDRLWDFEFLPLDQYKPQVRPRQYEGQARTLSFQVERSIYDDILLRHAEEMGVQVFEECKVNEIGKDGDRVTHISTADGKRITAKYYIDASGNAGTLRRAMDVNVYLPSTLQNVAFWDYWDNSEWATQFPGEATRVLIMSVSCGWIWYIPIGLTRTSIGFVCPANFYKEKKLSPAEIYDWALAKEPLIAELTKNASRDGEVKATKDWSFVAERMHGENWYLVGESAGFADPILSAGLTLTHTAARELAYNIVALENNMHDKDWLDESFVNNQRNRVEQHIRFADFWYAGNGIFTDLQEFTTKIAADAGLSLSPQEAFRWLGTGGFSHDNLGQVGIGGLDLTGARQVAQMMFDDDFPWAISSMNVFNLNLSDAEKISIAYYADGQIEKLEGYKRGNQVLPLVGLYRILHDIIGNRITAERLFNRLNDYIRTSAAMADRDFIQRQAIQVMEVMIGDGWVTGRLDKAAPRLKVGSPREGQIVHSNKDLNQRIDALSLVNS